MLLRTRTSLLGSDPTERYRQRILPIEGADGSTLSLDFESGTIDPRLTFTRASEGAFVDRTGKVVTAVSGSPRFDYHPITLKFRGLMLETSMTNLMKRSQAFTNAYWNDTGNNTLAVDAVVGAGSPQDDLTASSLTESSGVTSVPHFVTQAVGEFIPAANTPYTMSIWVKQPTSGNIARYIQLAFWTSGFGVTAYMNYDIQLGLVGSGGAGTTGTITPYKSGWYRITATATSVASPTTSGFQLGFSTSTSSVRAEATIVPSGTEKTIYIWGPQTELGSAATSVLITRASQATRVADSLVSTGNGLANWFLNSYSAGTFFFCGAIINTVSGYTRLFALTQSATINNAVGSVPAINVGVAASASNQIFLNAFVAANNDVDMYVPVGSAVVDNTEFTLSASYKAGDYRVSRKNLSATASFGSVGTTWGVNMFFNSVNGVPFPVVWYKQFKFFPSRLSNEQQDVWSST